MALRKDYGAHFGRLGIRLRRVVLKEDKRLADRDLPYAHGIKANVRRAISKDATTVGAT
jgi:hypothetical protein